MTHTAKQMIPAVGETVIVRVESFQVRMRILDAKSAYGNVRLLVTPVTGEGEAWIDCSRIVRVFGKPPVQMRAEVTA
jgi:hypothetical protein